MISLRSMRIAGPRTSVEPLDTSRICQYPRHMPATEPLPADVYDRLDQAATNVAVAEQALRRARDRLDSAIYDAVKRRGCQVQAIARATTLTRETVYKAAGRA